MTDVSSEYTSSSGTAITASFLISLSSSTKFSLSFSNSSTPFPVSTYTFEISLRDRRPNLACINPSFTLSGGKSIEIVNMSRNSFNSSSFFFSSISSKFSISSLSSSKISDFTLSLTSSLSLSGSMEFILSESSLTLS
ncbi:137aa long hypothetical protein [Pyrococcus horikoshii OT3]|uniref:Uncharacterized protein n=1 Tax=Pyrococcus horikoshii (strain ATCC 700860 / DSM 12428 / JCM 9974 / NBRC 100139 / OT-3) TaxID=70601 RepID=O58199_PYRHO|nr:137aa long hypothetical protein [Pyrococcus horikoshii OT3]